jgi:predicted O-methyltransferase YrrM
MDQARMPPATPILAQMREIEGWLTDDEAELLMVAVADALAANAQPGAFVELGSYCGRSTVVIASVLTALTADVRLHAIDPHLEAPRATAKPGARTSSTTLPIFQRNIANAGLADRVVLLQQLSYETGWHEPISFMFVDAEHDYQSVARDVLHFEPWLVDGALVAFHDYSTGFPGVIAFVDELLASGRYVEAGYTPSLKVVRRSRRQPRIQTFLERTRRRR